MNTTLCNYQRFILCIGILLSMLLAACTDEQATEAEGDTLQLLNYSKEFAVTAETRAVSVPAGYEPFTIQHPEIETETTSIGLYLTGTRSPLLRRIVYENDHWQSYTKVKDGENYYIFGFAPMEGTNGSRITPVLTDYSSGANLYINGVNTLSARDLCVVIGVKGAESSDEDVEVKAGNFAYQGKDKGLNYAYLLFDHLYSAVQFSIRIESDYAELRNIRMKNVVLKTDAASTVDIGIELQPRELPIASVDITPRGTTQGELSLLSTEQALTISYEALGRTCYFCTNARSSLKLVSTYDVYDSEGTLVRENCVSENKLSFMAAVNRGEKRNIQLTVKPTYLYQLSEKDLDNPTISVN